LAIVCFVTADFSSDKYLKQSGADKLSQIWTAVTKDTTPSDFPSAFSLAKIFVESMAPTFTTMGDEFVDGR
jgi:hypothetical protein